MLAVILLSEISISLTESSNLLSSDLVTPLDVVLSSSKDLPVCLLEVNLSCNFFRGSFDKQLYMDFCEDLVAKMQEMRLKADEEGKKFK